MSDEQLRNPGDIPPGITFGNKVIKLPYTSNVFNRAIWIQACLIWNPRTLFKSYTWVKRGDNLIEFTIFSPKIGIPLIDFFAGPVNNKIYLRSPVDGLLLHDHHDFGERDQWDRCNTSLLLPDDEPPANDGEYMFRHLCNFCWENREYMFYRPSEFEGQFNDENLLQEFSEQKQRACKYVDALPEYQDYLQEARTRHSQLRPYLKHLL